MPFIKFLLPITELLYNGYLVKVMDQSLVFFFQSLLHVNQVLGDVALVDKTLALSRVQLFRCSQKLFVECVFVDLLKSEISNVFFTS
jgi:hypothetical protein